MPIDLSSLRLALLAPELTLTLLAVAVMVVDLFIRRKEVLGYLSLASVFATLVLVFFQIGVSETAFYGSLIVDGYAVFFKLIILVATLLILIGSLDYVKGLLKWPGEYYALLLLSTVGMMLMAGAGDLIMLYVALELGTMSFATLVCLVKSRAESGEAALKYLLLAAFSSAVLLYGFALLYGMTGSTQMSEIARRLSLPGMLRQPAVLVAVALLVAGFGFKISAVPFQMWVPDVYTGAPTTITALLAVVSKTAGFAALLRLFVGALGVAQADWSLIVAILAAVTMTVGNLMAFGQTNVKRLLAYSSIGQAGYVMVGLAVAAKASAVGLGTSGVLYFLLAYAFTNVGAFIAIIAFANATGSDEIEDYAGLAARSPFVAFGLTICLLSLVGMPPTAGFVSKVYIFYTAFVQEGLLWLVLIAVLNTAISMYYYLRPIKLMYLDPAKSDARPVPTSGSVAFGLSTAIVGVVLVALLAGPLIGAAQSAASGMIR